MASRYWVGGTGTWSNTAHWASVDGGAGGETIPTNTDDVYFTAASFTGAGQTVTVAAGAYCRSLAWAGATNSPTFVINADLMVYGSLTFISAMTLTMHATTGFIKMNSNVAGNLITTAGKSLSNLWFQGAGGGYSLLDTLTVTGALGIYSIMSGTLNTNGRTVTVTGPVNIVNPCTLTLGASAITCSIWYVHPTTTLSAALSTINVATDFYGQGKTYGTVNLTGTATTIVTGGNHYTTLAVPTPLKTVQFKAGDTQVVSNFTATGTAGNLITLGPNGVGTWSLLKVSGTVTCDYISLSYSNGIGGATFNAGANSTDGGNNTGWTFGGAPPVTSGGSGLFLGVDF